jgi:phage baseplate assembly protein W
MSLTNSIAFPNMFNISNNSVAVYEDLQSVTNRTKLLLLASPTELYNNPDFGVGLKQYMWQYNSPNLRPIIEQNIKEQLSLHEPCAIPNETIFADGLQYTNPDLGQVTVENGNQLNMTVAVVTTFGSQANINLNSDSLTM